MSSDKITIYQLYHAIAKHAIAVFFKQEYQFYTMNNLQLSKLLNIYYSFGTYHRPTYITRAPQGYQINELMYSICSSLCRHTVLFTAW